MDLEAVESECFLVLFKTDLLEESDDRGIAKYNFSDSVVALLKDPELEFIWVRDDIFDYFE